MPQVQSIRTFAVNANNLEQSEAFYTKVLAAKVIRRVEPTAEQLQKGRVKEVDVELGICRCICSMPRKARVREFRIIRS